MLADFIFGSVVTLFFLGTCEAAEVAYVAEMGAVILIPFVAPVITAVVETAPAIVPTVTAAAAATPIGWIIAAIAGIVCVVAIAVGLMSSPKGEVPYVDKSKSAKKCLGAKISKEQERALLEGAKGKEIIIECVHVSCRSCHPGPDASKWNAIGFILYSFGGRLEWTLNRVKCKAGYVVIISSDKVKKARTKWGRGKTLHFTAFRMIFGVYPSELKKTLIGGGFSVQKGVCVFNSASINCGIVGRDKDHIHFGTKVMNPVEQVVVSTATQRWMDKHVQNTPTTMCKLERNLLVVHPDFDPRRSAAE